MLNYILYFDGSCGPKNPGGTAAWGFVLKEENGIWSSDGHGVIGTGPLMTNNLAEFTALAEGLLAFYHHAKEPATLAVYGDSNLVIGVMGQGFHAKETSKYWPAYVRAKNLHRALLDLGVKISYKWVPREQNQECDDLSKLR